MKHELKPCPFCGGPAYLERCQRGFMHAVSTKVAYVRCLDCNARSGKFDLADYGCTSSSAEAAKCAAEAWNRRAEGSAV